MIWLYHLRRNIHRIPKTRRRHFLDYLPLAPRFDRKLFIQLTNTQMRSPGFRMADNLPKRPRTPEVVSEMAIQSASLFLLATLNR